MAEDEWLSEWEDAIAKLAHATLLLLREGKDRTRFELGRFASEYSTRANSVSGQGSGLYKPKNANVALKHLVDHGFVDETNKRFRATPKGLQALERYPDVFSALFVQRELLS